MRVEAPELSYEFFLRISSAKTRRLVRFVRQDETPFARWFFGACWFLRKRWVTVGRSIYYPTNLPVFSALGQEAQARWLKASLRYIAHELRHVDQWLRFGPLFPILYFALPLPALFSGRYFLERAAFARDVIFFGIPPEVAAGWLCSGQYLWPWPRFLAVRWFRKVADRRLRSDVTG